MICKRLFSVLVYSTVLFGCLLYSPIISHANKQPQSPNVTISVITSSFLGFGHVDTTVTRVLATGLITINLNASGLGGYNAASLRVYIDNDPDDPNTLRRGMVGQSVSTETVPFKVWTPNFGYVNNEVPDIHNDLNWKSNFDTKWLYVLDKNNPVTETGSTPWDHPLFNYTDLIKWNNVHPNSDFHIPSTLNLQEPIHFALVLEQKARPQDYSTQVYFEFALSDDYGETFITYTTSATLSVTVDDAPPIMNMEVYPSEFNAFPNLDPWPQRVLASGPLTLTLSAYGLYAYDAATIRVYTKNDPNDPDQKRLGLVGHLDPSTTVPIKVWTPNFGPGIDTDGDDIPDINHDVNWHDPENATWISVLDWNQPVTETWWNTLPIANPFYDPQCAWCQPLFNYTDLIKWSDYHNRKDDNGDFVYHLPNFLELTDRQFVSGADHRIPLYIAADFSDAIPQTYSTTLYIEFAFSDDMGANVAQNVVIPVIISATLNNDPPLVSMEVDETDFDNFPKMGPWPQRVLSSAPLTLTLSAQGIFASDAATLRIYTKNNPDDPDQKRLGLVGHLDPSATVPIKVWTPNFGPDTQVPDINNNLNWRDATSATWFLASDWSEPVTETWWATLPITNPFSDPLCAWCYSLFNYTDLIKWSDYHHKVDNGDFVYHLPNFLDLTDRQSAGGADNRIPLYVAADFTDALPQSYSTTLYIEFALSNDQGDNITQSVIETIVISATVPGDGSPINWLLNRVNMRPDMDASTATIEKLADSNQEPQDWADSGWTYDQALAVMALTAAGHHEQAQQVLNGLEYLQNDDGSWFYSYMTSVTNGMIEEWAATDETKLYDGATCLTEIITTPNSYPDELEQRVCWDVTHAFTRPDQAGPWLFEDYTSTHSLQTDTLLPDKIKYRVTDFRKFTGSNAWVIMAANFYEMQTGDSSYRPMAINGLNWLNNQRDPVTTSTTYGGLSMGRVWFWWAVSDTLTTTHGFSNSPVYITEHNLDAYSAYTGMGLITGEDTYVLSAERARDFLLKKLWAPHVITNDHPDLQLADIKDVFFAAINMGEPEKPKGAITTCIFLDGQSWSILTLGPDTQVKDTNGNTVTLDVALAYLNQTMLVSDTTIFSSTGYKVTNIDGYKENDGDDVCEFSEDNFVWSEGSEGVVAAYYWTGDTTQADYYHEETKSYMMTNGGVPYSTLPANSEDQFWTWTNTNSIAGTAWFYFNEPEVRLNPFQYWIFNQVQQNIFLPIIFKNN